ncbi:MAG: PAS domain S-box protein [Bacteroidia bacterium]|nr:PAS domain S-box protein [Bacteroidia bacterium]
MDIQSYFNLFTQSSALMVVMETDFTIVEVSDAYLKATYNIRDNIIGKNIFDVFPDNPNDETGNGSKNIRNSLIRVLKHKIPDTISALKYHIPKLQSEGIGYEVKYWKHCHYPIFDADNEVMFLVQNVEDVTENESLIKLLKEEKKTAEAFEISNHYIRNIFMKTPALVCMLRGPEHILEMANETFLKFVGNNNFIGKTFYEAFPDQDFLNILDDVYKSGKSFTGIEISAKFLTGNLENVFLDVVCQAFNDINGKIYGVLMQVIKVTERVLARKKIEDSEKRYSMMLMQSPFAFAVLKGRDMVITLANDSMKKIWSKGQNIEGIPLFDIFPELKETQFPGLLNNVYKTGNPFYGDEVLAQLQRADKLEDTYFNFIYQPYLEADETISGVTAIVYEVTAKVLLKKALAEQREIERKALRNIEESNKRYHLMLMESPFAFSVMKGKDMVITLANDLMKDFWGKGKDVEDKTLLQVLPELADQPFPDMIYKVYTSGIPIYSNEILARLKHVGKIEDRYFNIVYQPYHEADGTISGVTTIAYEVTEMVLSRKKIEESEFRYRMLIEEASVATALFLGPQIRVHYANDIMLGYWGKGKSVLGKTLIEVMPELIGQPFISILEVVYATGKSYTGVEEKAVFIINGSPQSFYFNFTFKALRDKDGTIYGIHINSIDVTLHVLAKKALEESEKHFRLMVDLMPLKISNADAEGKMLYFNKHWFEFIGVDHENLKNWGYLKIIHPDELEEFQKRFLAASLSGSNLEMEMRFKNKNGEYKWHLNIATPVKDENGNIKIWLGSSTEIHEQKTATEKIKESEARFKLMVAQAPAAMCILRGPKYIVELANEKMLQFCDRTTDVVINKPIFEAIPYLSGQGFEELLNNVYNTGIGFVNSEMPVKVLRKGKHEDLYIKLVFEALYEDAKISGVMALAVEITEEVRIRKKIEESEYRYHNMIYSSPSLIAIFGGEEMIIDIANEPILESWGKGKDIVGKSLFSVIPEITESGLDKILLNVYKTGTPFHAYEMPINILRHGKWQLMHYTFVYQAQRNINGIIEGVAVIANEVTPQALLNKKIKESETIFRQLADSMPQKITIADKDGNLTYFNQQWLDDTGYSFEGLKELGWEKIIHPQDFEKTLEVWLHSIKTGDIFDFEFRIKNIDGDYKWHLSRAVPLKDENGKISMWVGSTTEINEQIKLKTALELSVKERTKELEQANNELIFQNEEKGKRAAELITINKELLAFTFVSSHDLQEPLRKIQTLASLILEREFDNLSVKGKDYFRRMNATANRMQTLLKDLLAYSRTSTIDRKFELTDLNLIIEEVKSELKETIEDKHATIEASELCSANIIHFQFRQLMQNLIANALKFSKPNLPPHITIKSRVQKGSKLNDLNLSPDKEYCHISIKDNGIGFEPEFKTRIFEMFQRLHDKEEYEGTGIGLSIAKKIMDNHGGIIIATSKLNKGATFDLYIPVILPNNT